VRQGTYETNGEVRASFTTMLTGKGEQWLTKRLIAGGVLPEVPPIGVVSQILEINVCKCGVHMPVSCGNGLAENQIRDLEKNFSL
ncbi:phage antirepressor KilAC domain-containing protein, partial [Salmonella enterica subsp. enterica serovar Kentucky]|nr:phage antirepressor KilAC domain-containing protein [Salmonella enterica subsp. enterica serovar Kentucky]